MLFYPEWVGITGRETKEELEREAIELEKRRQEEASAASPQDTEKK